MLDYIVVQWERLLVKRLLTQLPKVPFYDQQ